MILILSNNSDYSTYKVIKWLDHFNEPWMRLNEDTKIIFESEQLGTDTEPNFKFKVVGQPESINISEIKSYWYRRSDLAFDLSFDLQQLADEPLRGQFSKHCHSELKYLRDGLHAILAEKHSINDRRYSDLNKYDVLVKAQKCGLKIPATTITTNKQDYLNFKNEHKSVISKAIQNGIRIHVKDSDDALVYQSYTELFNSKNEIPEIFFPTLFQKALEKKYEIRIFYINGQLYPMVIFSQSDEQTEIDFRKYNFDTPNRTMRYALPQIITSQLLALMKVLKLNSGSIDLIFTTSDEYIFLEVNPVGQFGMVSTPCNYGLEKIIAQNLANHE
jgi:ATP-GRASP peptide maturase of grasp-with-spasm system